MLAPRRYEVDPPPPIVKAALREILSWSRREGRGGSRWHVILQWDRQRCFDASWLERLHESPTRGLVVITPSRALLITPQPRHCRVLSNPSLATLRAAIAVVWP